MPRGGTFKTFITSETMRDVLHSWCGIGTLFSGLVAGWTMHEGNGLVSFVSIMIGIAFFGLDKYLANKAAA